MKCPKCGYHKLEGITVRDDLLISNNELTKLHRFARTNTYYKTAYEFIMRIIDTQSAEMTYEHRNYIMSILDDIR